MNFKDFLQKKGITQEDFDKKDVEEQAGLFNEFNDESKAAMQKLIDEKASKEDIDNLKSEILENQNNQLKALNATLKEHGVFIKKLTEEDRKEAKASFATTLRKGLEDNIEAVKKMDGASLLTVKAVGDITSANISGGNVPVEQRLTGLDDLASRRIRLLDMVSRGRSTSNLVSWVSKANREGAAGGTSEGASKNQIDFDFVVSSESAKKRTAFIKISTEMLNDIDFIESEINNELLIELQKDIEGQVYNGDNTGNNLNGLETIATAFAAGVHAGTVDNANIVDVIVAAMDQIEVAEQEPANAILMHPSDVASLSFIKVSATDKRYVFENGRASINGVPIIKTTLVTQGDYLVGYFPNALLLDHEEISIMMGVDGNDLTKNMRTFIAEWRGMLIVKTNKRASFVTGDFATDEAALETA